MVLDIVPVGTDEWMRMLLYTFPGHGKTSLIGTCAAMGPTLIIRSSMDLMPSRILKTPNLHQVTADTHEKMLEVLDYCRMTEPFPYLWVWWDCVSIAQDVLLDDVWAAAVANKPQRGWIMDPDTGQPTTRPNISPTGGKDKPEYGTNADRIGEWVRHMIGANKFHFGITAHPSEGQHPSNDEGGTLLRPWIQVKNMPEKICGYMNMVGFLEVDDDDPDELVRRLHFRENSRFYAKDQYDAFLPEGYLENPDMTKIMRAVEKARGKPLGTVGHTATTSRPKGRGATPTSTPARGRGRGVRA